MRAQTKDRRNLPMALALCAAIGLLGVAGVLINHLGPGSRPADAGIGMISVTNAFLAGATITPTAPKP